MLEKVKEFCGRNKEILEAIAIVVGVAVSYGIAGAVLQKRSIMRKNYLLPKEKGNNILSWNDDRKRFGLERAKEILDLNNGSTSSKYGLFKDEFGYQAILVSNTRI